jgi:arylsulfatase A-like enzyme
MPRPKNVIVFYTDQQRADSLGCMGNGLARTPNLDALAARGVLYRRHYAVNPVCMPSRCSFYTGLYPQAHRVIDNGIFLPAGTLTLPEAFRRAGWRTASIGKLHFQPFQPIEPDISLESMGRWQRGELDDWHGPYYGFEEVHLAVGHGEGDGITGHYGRWREKHFPREKLGVANAQGAEKHPEFICYKSNLPVEYHHSTWVADRAVEYLDRTAAGMRWHGRLGHASLGRPPPDGPGLDAPATHGQDAHATMIPDAAGAGQPFFLNVSFPDPHHPFVPPAPYSTMFDGVDFPPPHAVAGENDAKPTPYQRAMSGNPFPSDGGCRYRPELPGAYQQIMSHTYGMIALIDDCVGRVLAKLRELGLEKDTIIVFTSDHGDFLGDHFLIYKGQLPCRSLLNIPLIVVDPTSHQTGATPTLSLSFGVGVPGVVDAVCSNVDVAPTLLQRCGIDVPASMQGVILPPASFSREPQASACPASASRPYAFSAGWSKASPDYHHYTLTTQDWRLTVFPNLREGELYDLRADPWEHRNLFNDPARRTVRDELMAELLYAVGSAEPKRPPCVTDW